MAAIRRRNWFASCAKCGMRLSEWFVRETFKGPKMWCYAKCKTISPWSSHDEYSEVEDARDASGPSCHGS